MHASAFNLYVEDFPAAGQLLVHNSFSGAFAVLDEHEAGVLRKTRKHAELDADALAVIEDRGWRDPDVGLVVDCLQQEQAEYESWFAELRTRRVLQAMICINLTCNFDCPYCCQADVMDGSVMSWEVLAQTADWLAARAKHIGAERVQLMVVGGEPLLYPLRIKTLADRLGRALAPDNIEFAFGLITNGYFLTEEMVLDLLPYGLTPAQVTIDGDRTTQCQSRVSKRQEDTFDLIFNNVIAASQHIHIALNGNYQEHTIAGFAPLIDALVEAGLDSQHAVSFSPAFEMLSTPSGSAGGACDWASSPHGYRVALHDRIVAAGFQTTSLASVGPCGFHSHHLLVVDPAGNLFKCPGFLGHPEWRIGHVEGGLTERYQQMLEWDVFSSCGSCAHRPNCGGSCVADEMLKTGQMQAKCEQDYLDEVRVHALPRAYLLAMHDDLDSALASFPPPPVELPRTNDERLSAHVNPPPASGRAIRSAALRVL